MNSSSTATFSRNVLAQRKFRKLSDKGPFQAELDFREDKEEA